MGQKVYLQDLVSHRAVAKQGHHALDALIGPFLVVILGALDGVKQPISVIRNAFKHIVDPEEKNYICSGVISFKIKAAFVLQTQQPV